MENDLQLETTAIIDIDEAIRKEEELLNTIRMEPILDKVTIDEEPGVEKKKKMMKLTDYFLLALMVILSIVFILVILNVR